MGSPINRSPGGNHPKRKNLEEVISPPWLSKKRKVVRPSFWPWEQVRETEKKKKERRVLTRKKDKELLKPEKTTHQTTRHKKKKYGAQP